MKSEPHTPSPEFAAFDRAVGKILSVSHEEIHRRIKREVTALLWKLDGYLRSWEVEPGSERTTRVAVGAYASEDPIITGAATADADGPPPRRRSRRGRMRAARNT